MQCVMRWKNSFRKTNGYIDGSKKHQRIFLVGTWGEIRQILLRGGAIGTAYGAIFTVLE